jgi:thiamine biosynthesis lipoprotein
LSATVFGATPERRVVVPPILTPLLRRSALCGVHVIGGETMGTTWSIKLVAPDGFHSRSLRAQVERELDRLVGQMSSWLPGSDITVFNTAVDGSWHVLPPEFFTVLDCALAIANETGGAYDPTTGMLVDLWGFGPRGAVSQPPADDAVAEAMTHTGHRHVTLDRSSRRARRFGGTVLDLSSIAKGFAVDRLAALLRGGGFDSFLVEIGGELYGAGMKPDGSPWWVALEGMAVPDLNDGGERIANVVVALHGLSVATSGESQRHFEHRGVRYAHTIDPRTGYPLTNGMVSVSVLHLSCMEADALATAISVLGPDEGFRYAEERNVAAILTYRSSGALHERITPAFASMLS